MHYLVGEMGLGKIIGFNFPVEQKGIKSMCLCFARKLTLT